MPDAYAPIDTLRQEVGLNQDNGASLRAEPVFTSFPASLDGAAKISGRIPFRVSDTQIITASNHATAAWAPKNDEPLVYITFGTIAASSSDRHVIYQNTLSAVKELSIQALLTTGNDMDASALGIIPNNVTVKP